MRSHDLISLGFTTNVQMNAASTCTPVDSLAFVRNSSCDTVTIESAMFGIGDYFQLAGPNLPKTLFPHDSAVLKLRANAPIVGSYSDTLHLRLRTGAGRMIDTSILLQFAVRNDEGIELSPLTARLRDRCSVLDTTIQIVNSRCDTILVMNVTPTDPSLISIAGSIPCHRSNSRT